jgi:hypothetical protein
MCLYDTIVPLPGRIFGIKPTSDKMGAVPLYCRILVEDEDVKRTTLLGLVPDTPTAAAFKSRCPTMARLLEHKTNSRSSACGQTVGEHQRPVIVDASQGWIGFGRYGRPTASDSKAWVLAA